MTRRVAVRAVIEKDGKLLLVKLKPYQTALKGDYWCTIGGSVEDNESLLDALEREVVEETGIKPSIGNLLFVQQFADDTKEHLEFFFHVTNAEDFQNIDLSKTEFGKIEIADINFVDPKTVTVLPEFLSSINTESLNDQKTKFFDFL